MLKHISEAVQPIAATPSAPKAPTIPKTPTPSTSSAGSTPSAPAGNAAPKIDTSAVKAKIESAVSESADLITALECVGAMYGIPATNIIADPNATGIKISNDNIIAPPVPAKNQAKPIIQAVGGVLDYISQRIDDKLNAHQLDNIEQGRIEDSIKRNANPQKGKVIGRYEDDEGGEILAYDTGLVDMPNTDAARSKVAELRASNTIPTFDPSIGSKNPGDEYFNDEDDITNDVEMEAASDKSADAVDLEENDIAEKIQESAYHVNMYTKMGDTTHLGYDLMRKHGFDFVKPLDSIVMESKEEDDEKESKKNKVRTSDIKYMKFDNKNILKAVDYFNAARENQENAKKMNLKEFFNDPNFDKGLDCLNKQFNCRINLRVIQTKPGKYENCSTAVYNDLKKKLTISKAKGFQLGGLPITININMKQILGLVPANRKLFGQSLTAVLLHEIYHNIVHMIGVRNKNLHNDIQKTVGACHNTKSFEGAKATISSFIARFKDKFSIKDESIDEERVMKRMYVLTQIQDNPGAVKKFEKDIKHNTDQTNTDEEIERYIKSMEMVKDYVIFKRGLRVVSATCCILLAGLGFAFGSAVVGVAGVVGLAVMSLSMLKKKVLSLFGLSTRLQEEYFCDLFASMYKLPIHLSSYNRQIKLNQQNAEKMKRLRELDQKIDKHLKDDHPLNFDREVTSYKVAKQLLESGQTLTPEEREYLEYIVNLHEGIDTIDNPHSKRQAKKLNPEAAADLQKTLNDFVNKTGVSVTESFIDGGDENGS